ncbi:MAG: sigma-54 dependent transcriptional regulator [Candidatus Eisenbacteria bacterium]
MPHKNAGRILVVDDEKSIRNTIARILEYEGYVVREADDGRAALSLVGEEQLDAVVLDIKMPGMDGIEVLRRVKEVDPGLPVIILSGHGTIATAVEATALGAFNFLEKPPDRDKLLINLRNAVAGRRLASEKASLEKTLTKGLRLVGESAAIKNLIATMERIGPTDAKVLITGENGVGKGVVARAIHKQSKRAEARFVEVSCAAIPDDLIESELFGYEKGAFTGAVARKPGRFEIADGGTIFLDEIADMSPLVQAKVLRVIEEAEFERVGGTDTLRVDVRLVAATNKDLRALIKEGKFREDLYYRLNVVVIDVPPLRSRKEDIPVLAKYFLDVYCEMYGLRPKTLDGAVLDRLKEYAWPGNVRELRNIIERMVITSRADTLRLEDLPPLLETLAETLAARPGGAVPLSGGETYEEFKNLSEKKFLEERLEASNWNISKTAQELQMQRSNLYKKMQKLGIAQRDKI